MTKKRDLPDSYELDYIGAIEEIKQQIRRSRYQAAGAVNRELLILYSKIGKILSERVKLEEWGSKVLDRISKDIREEFEGIKGFSKRNLIKMRQFYENYVAILIGPSSMGQMEGIGITPSVKAQIEPEELGTTALNRIRRSEIRPSPTAQVENARWQSLPAKVNFEEFATIFFLLSFTHHIILIQKCSDLQERFFYMKEAVQNQWPYRSLQYHIESDLYHQRGQLDNNFERTLPAESKKYVMDSFKSEYLLNFLSPKDDLEVTLESEIVTNIQDFLEALGSDFTFIGNQYRVVVEGDEFFVDLLFYHRRLHSLIAVELKTGKFRPEFIGKMQFYLAALDDIVKHDDENPSIGLILCQGRKKTVVKYTLRDSNSPIGVAEYRIVESLGEKLIGRIGEKSK